MTPTPTAADLRIRLRRIDDLRRANLVALLDLQVTEAEWSARKEELGSEELDLLILMATHYPVCLGNDGSE